MERNELSVIIEKYRALTEMSSLPFSVIHDGERKLAWFNFIIETKNEGMIGIIDKIYLIDKIKSISVIDTAINEKIPDIDCTEPTVDEDVYIENICKIYNNIDYEDNINLLKQSVLEVFIPLYETVYQKLMKEE